jgi:hypothetical protein
MHHFISQAEAIGLIKEFRKRGHITQAFFKVATADARAFSATAVPSVA